MKRGLILVAAVIVGFAIGSVLGSLRSLKVSEPGRIETASEARDLQGTSAAFATNDDAAKALFSADHERRPLRRAFEVLEVIRKLNADQTAEMVARVHKLRGDTRSRMLSALLAHWIELDPAAAKEWVAPFMRRIVSKNSDDDVVLYAWARANPKAMIEELVKRPHLEGGSELMTTALEALPERDLVSKLDAISNLPPGKLRDRSLWDYLGNEISEKPEFALGQLRRLGTEREFREARASALKNLALRAPTEVIGKLGELVSDAGNDSRSEKLLKDVVSQVSTMYPKAILDWLAEQPESVSAQTRTALAIGWSRTDPIAALNWALENNIALDARAFDDHRTVVYDNNQRLIEAAAKKDPVAVLDWIRKRPATEERDGLFLAVAEQVDAKAATVLFKELPIEAQTRLAKVISRRFTGQGGTDWFEWLDNVPAGSPRQEAISTGTMRQVMYSRPTMEDIEGRYAAGPDRDAALRGSAVGLAEKDLRPALAMAQAIRDGGVRESALWEVAKIWSYNDPKSASEWIESTKDLSAETKASLIRQLHDDRVEYQYFQQGY